MLKDPLLSVEWKTKVCSQGKDCWCRIIVPKERLTDEEGNELYVVGSGSIPKEYATHLVKLHNNSLKK